MQQKKLKVSNKLGLHARAAAKIVTIANNYNSNIHLIYQDKTANGKSIMSIMILAASEGAEIEIIIDGLDEQEHMLAIEELFNNKFGES